MNEKQLFFKTVRSNGDSVWACKGLKRNYKIGQRYTFPSELPAHVFASKRKNALRDIYDSRCESSGGNRVLICWGKLDYEYIPCIDIHEKKWDREKLIHKSLKECSDDFEVVGEIFVPNAYKSSETKPKNSVWEGEKP